MTDPNTKVILTSDLFDDDPCSENMSASAFAVLDAYMVGYGWLCSPTKEDCRGVAAALRAAADLEQDNPWPGRIESVGAMWMRDRLLAIAAELEQS
jgi:hypothetical protein